MVDPTQAPHPEPLLNRLTDEELDAVWEWMCQGCEKAEAEE